MEELFEKGLGFSLQRFAPGELLKKSAGAKKIYTREQELADQVWSYFGKRLPFARIMKMIKDKGYQEVYETWNEVKQSDAKDHLSLFIWKIKELKIKWDTNSNAIAGKK